MADQQIQDLGDGYTAMQLLDTDASMRAITRWAHSHDAQVLTVENGDRPYLQVRHPGARIWSGALVVGDWLVLTPTGRFQKMRPEWMGVYVPTEEAACPHDSRSGADDGRWRCDECGADCGANTYLTETGGVE